MNAVSTPITQSSTESLQETFTEVTPIKYFRESENECENFKCCDSNRSDNTLFGDGKRKIKHSLNSNQTDAIKKLKMNEIEHFRGNEHVSKSFGNITPGVDMFEDDFFNHLKNTPTCHMQNCQGISGVCQVNTNIVKNSFVEKESEILENELLDLNSFENFDERIPIDSDKELENNLCRHTSNDSYGLSVFLKENAVVDSILNAMNLINNSNSENEVNMETSVKNEFSHILMESVVNWDKSGIIKNEESATTEKLTDKIKRRLMDNVNNLKTIKSEGTGWSQIDELSNISDDMITLNSQCQELGPFFGLPSKVQKLYEEHKGIKDLYSWQKECLTLKAIKERKNLVYSLPTSGGKTLVAEILILRELLCFNRNVLFILPFVSIVQEKVHDLSIFALELGFLVEEYAAGKGAIPLRKRRKRRSVIIATIEKASAVVISLIEKKQLHEFGLVVVDELHLISEDSGRGSTLESLLTHILHLGERIQIIGMTATIGNLNEIASFLNAETYTGSFRPVELKEFVKCGNDVFAVNWGSEEILLPIRSVKSPAAGTDPDGISELVLEVVPNDSVLVFCPTKKNCENVALLIANIMPRHLLNYKEVEKLSFLKALKSETNGQICPVMKKTVPYGVVYHHSGLTPGERKLLEEAFRAGTLAVICCTSTLAAGINLPAARVILRSPYVGRDFISLSKYKQMIGRAGRAGMGSKGESYLICQPTDSSKVGILLQSKMEDAMSKMDLDSLKSLILSSIGLGVATTRGELRNLVYRTLLNVQAEKLNIDIKKMIDACISSLFKMGAIKVKELEDIEENENNSKLDITAAKTGSKNIKITNDSQLSVSRLGRAAMKGCIGVERAHELYGDLIKGQASLVLLTELHLLYLVIPYDTLDQIRPDYSVYFDVYMQLSAKELPAAKVIGVTEFVISKLATGMKPKNISESILNRFYVALILNEMLKQQNIWNVAKLFQISAGMVQTLMTSTSTFANNILRFCEELQELWSFKSLLTEFAPRLAHCCSSELIPLLELPAVKRGNTPRVTRSPSKRFANVTAAGIFSGNDTESDACCSASSEVDMRRQNSARGRAKQLYDAGFKTLQIVANADVNEMVKSVDHLPKRVARQITAAARLLLLEKAENLKEEAEEVLQGLAEKIVSG